MHRILLVLAVALATLLTVPAAVAAAPNARAADPFPVTLRSPAGTVTLKKQPRRIVSLSPTATETLFAIGAARQVVAVDDQSDFPRRAPRTRLSGFTPNAEAVAGYRPDLVIVSYDANRIVSSLRQLGIPVLLQPTARDLLGAYAQMRQLGRATGRRHEANSLVARLRTRIARLTAEVRPRARGHRVYHEISPDLWSASSRSFVGSVYRLFGLTNIADAADTGSGFSQLSAEYVVAQNPTLIVLADTVCCAQTRATVSSRPGFDRIRAVRTGAIVRLHDSIASRWGPRVLNFVQALARALRTVPRA